MIRSFIMSDYEDDEFRPLYSKKDGMKQNGKELWNQPKALANAMHTSCLFSSATHLIALNKKSSVDFGVK